jgi:hypothetical protein
MEAEILKKYDEKIEENKAAKIKKNNLEERVKNLQEEKDAFGRFLTKIQEAGVVVNKLNDAKKLCFEVETIESSNESNISKLETYNSQIKEKIRRCESTYKETEDKFKRENDNQTLALKNGRNEVVKLEAAKRKQVEELLQLDEDKISLSQEVS